MVSSYKRLSCKYLDDLISINFMLILISNRVPFIICYIGSFGHVKRCTGEQKTFKNKSLNWISFLPQFSFWKYLKWGGKFYCLNPIFIMMFYPYTHTNAHYISWLMIRICGKEKYILSIYFYLPCKMQFDRCTFEEKEWIHSIIRLEYFSRYNICKLKDNHDTKAWF